jgi:D-sedoheptulose 7-phosphate isomerase
MNQVIKSFNDHQQIIERVEENCTHQIGRIARLMVEVLTQGGTIFWCGNGGSAADSQHLAAELVGRFARDRRALRSVALTTDSSILTSVANDSSYDAVFSRQIEALGRFGDLLVVISTSGNSNNIIYALQTAKVIGLHTVGLLGKDGGKAKNYVDQHIIIPSQSTARIQEAHILVGHCFCELIEYGLGITEFEDEFE